MDTTTIITHKFENGREFKGTIPELVLVGKSLGLKLVGLELPRGYYNSASDGIVEVKSMHSFHIRRALLKATTEYMKKVFSNGDTNKEFLAKYAGLVDDNTIQDLLSELVERGDEIVPADEPKKATKK